jgi:hypothetical protein
MLCIPRFILAGIAQHVIQSGHDREPCFYGDDDCVKKKPVNERQ